jgi:hypothetical protein
VSEDQRREGGREGGREGRIGKGFWMERSVDLWIWSGRTCKGSLTGEMKEEGEWIRGGLGIHEP